MTLAVIIQIDGWNVNTAAAETIRAASHDHPAVCHLNGQLWWPTIAELPKLRYDFFSGAFDGRIETPGSTVTLAIEAYPTFPLLQLADARFRLWTGNVGDAFGAYTLRFDGIVTEQPSINPGDGTVSIDFAVDDRWLDEPLLDLYEGTGGLEGEAAMKGVPKPLCIGTPRYAPGKMIDSTNMVLQLSAYGAMQGIDTALERLVRFGVSTGNSASLAALIAAAIPAGGWGTCTASGLVRHGAKLTGLVSYLARGDAAGVDGWVKTPGKVIKRLCEIKGYVAKVSEASLDALDISRPYNLSLYQGDQITLRDIIQRIAASVNAVMGVSWLSQLFVAPIEIDPAPATTLRADGTALPIVGDVERIGSGAPYWRMAVQADRTWTVHGQSDIAYDVDPGITALAALDDIADDNLLTPGEKPIAIKEYQALLGEQGGIDVEATAYGVTTEKTNYDNAVTALTAYLAGLTVPVAWNNLTGNTTIVGGTFRAKFNDVLITRQALCNKLDSLGSNRRNIEGGGNRVPFSKFETGYAAYWSLLFNPSAIGGTPTQVTTSNRSILRSSCVATGAGQQISMGSVSTAGYFPVTPAERLSVQVALNSTGTMGGACSLLIRFYNSAGGQIGGGTTVASTTGLKALGTILGDFVTVPANSVKAQLEVYFASTGSGAGTAAILEADVRQASQDQTILPAFTAGPNANDGGTVGAPTGTPVGTITAGDVSSTINSGGGVGNNQVSTNALQDNSATAPWYVESSSGIVFAAATRTEVLSIPITKATAGSVIEINTQIPFYAADAVDGAIELEVQTTGGAVVANRTFNINLDANNATQLPLAFNAFFSGIAAANYNVKIYFTRSSGNTCQTNNVRHGWVREFKK